MKSKKSMVLFVLFLFLPLTQFASGENRVIFTQIKTENENILRLDPIRIKQDITFKQGYDYYFRDSDPLEYAKKVEYFAWENFDVSTISKSRIHDLAVVQMILSDIDLFFTVNDSFFIFEAKSLVSELYLDVNSSLIRGEPITSNYKINAADNFLLVLMYERLALALQANGDFDYLSYQSLADSTLSTLVNLFYFPTTMSLNSTLIIDTSSFVIGGYPYSSAKATGLFTMANYLSSTPSLYYNQTKDALDTYMKNANKTISLGFGDGSLFLTTLNSGTSTDNEADLQGNLYMVTALLQHSSYQKTLNNITAVNYYYEQAEYFEISIFEGFLSDQTQLLHTSYDFSTLTLSNTALTYENCLAISQAIEFFRKRWEEYQATPIVFFYSNIVESLYNQLFVIPDFFEAGITTAGTLIFADWETLYLNPISINFQAVTMLTKVFPIRTILAIPYDIQLFNQTIIEFNIDFPETTSIFKSSTSYIPYSFSLESSSTSNLNITHQTNINMNTTKLDGVEIKIPKLFHFTFIPEVGGSHDFTFTLNHPALSVLEFTYYFYILKEIRILTDSELQAIQGYDDALSFSVECLDEQSYGIKNVNLTVSDGFRNISALTDSSGNVFFSIDLEDILNQIDEIPPDVVEIEIPLIFYAWKNGYQTTVIIRSAYIKLNALNLMISPSPLEIKESQDLTLYLSVSSQIEATVIQPRASLRLNGEDILINSQQQINLPNSISIDWTDIKSAEEKNENQVVILEITVTSANFEDTVFAFEIDITPLKTLEKIYNWIETALQSDWVKVLGSLGILWALLWKQFQLHVLKRLRRCPYCGETSKSKYAICRYCGRVVNEKKLPKDDDKKGKGDGNGKKEEKIEGEKNLKSDTKEEYISKGEK
ncbi:MAG: hypothetical protein ACTSX6_10170, partial [Candidatus Heimdallarchaeaceae archaeon]